MQESLISPYKSLGLFLSSTPPVQFSAGGKSFLAAPTSHSFKLYKLPDLKIKLLGPHFAHKIQAICAKNESLYLATKTGIVRLKYYHIERVYSIDDSTTNLKFSSMILIGEYLLASESTTLTLFLWDVTNEKPLRTWPSEFPIRTLIHPMTYLNKVLIVGRDRMMLFNIQASEVIFDFGASLEKALDLKKNALEITAAEQSPNLHIVALGFNSGAIVLYNIQMDTILFKLQQSNPVTTFAFSHRDIPLLASGDLQGNINLWELNDRRLFSSIKLASPVIFLSFLESELILLTGSDNAIFQWKYDDLESTKFRLIRERVGLRDSIKNLRFFGEEGLHIIASSGLKTGELRDFSLLNECMSRNFSHKVNTSVKKRNFDTENEETLNEVLDFSFAENRSKDWGTMLSCHRFSTKPCLWSIEDHTILKKRLEFLEDPTKNELKSDFVTAITVTKCGNFGLLGFKSGGITKLNLQSGVYQSRFRAQNGHTTSIIDLQVDHYNKVLLSLDESGSLIFWDFFSNLPEVHLTTSNFVSRVTKLELSRFSALFILILEDFSLELWDLYKRSRSRRFTGHENSITEAKFTPDNRFVVSAAMDRSLKIWDVISGSLIQDIRVDKPIVCFDISPDGELLASAFQNSRELNLWHLMVRNQPWGNRTVVNVRFQSRIRNVDNREKARFYGGKEEKIEDFRENNKEYEEFLAKFKEETDSGFTFSEIPEGKWLPLVHLDLIKEKNKPKLTEKIEVKLPFFLDVEHKDDIRQEIKEKVKEEALQKTRFMDQGKTKHLEEVRGTVLDRFFEVKDVSNDEVFEYLKGLNAAQWDFEMRRSLMAANPEKVRRMLEFFGDLLEKPQEFDIKQVFFNSFLNVRD